jgi:hypothetical protein
MAGQKLDITKEEKDLDVIISDNLKPAAQCAKAAKTAQTVLGQISRAFQYRNKTVFMQLYKQYAHLEFAVQACGTVHRRGYRGPRKGTGTEKGGGND